MATEQLALLSEFPASRRDDPSTSRQAEIAHTESGGRASQQHRVLEAVRAHPGRTSAELAQIIKTMDRYQVAKRLPDLAPMHVHCKEGIGDNARELKRACAVNGRPALVWYPGPQPTTRSDQ